MKLYILRRVTCGNSNCPQSHCDRYDVNNAVVVRAESKKQARLLASKAAFCEGASIWLSKQACGAHSTCERVKVKGNEEIIVISRRNG